MKLYAIRTPLQTYWQQVDSISPQIVPHSTAQDRTSHIIAPLETTLKLKEHVNNLMALHKPKTQTEKAIMLIQSMIHPRMDFVFNGVKYGGFSIAEGGLTISHEENAAAHLREKFGFLLPEIIISTPPHQRIAECAEFSLMLTVFLRQIKIPAFLKGTTSHTIIVATLDDQPYKLDVGYLRCEKIERMEGQLTDEEITTLYYHANAGILADQKKLERALESNTLALKLNPNWPVLWHNRGCYFQKLGKIEEARDCFNRAIQLLSDTEKKSLERIDALRKLVGTENGKIAAASLIGLIEIAERREISLSKGVILISDFTSQEARDAINILDQSRLSWELVKKDW
jgi:tetratricopeptide (TPR) repeat protein